MRQLNNRGFVKSIVIYLFIGVFVGGFVYAGSKSNSPTSLNAEFDREEILRKVERHERDSESRQSAETEKLHESVFEQAGEEASRESAKTEGPREARASRERKRESPDGRIGDGRRDPNGDATHGQAEDIPSASQPTTCVDKKEGEPCATLNFRYSQPHKSYLWYFTEQEAQAGFRILQVKALNSDVEDGKKLGGLRSLVVYYADGDREDLIQSAKESGKFSNRITESGALYFKKAEDVALYLRYKKPIEAVFIKADSWISKDKSIELEFRWLSETTN